MAQSLARLHVHVVFATKHLTKHGVTFDERYIWDEPPFQGSRMLYVNPRASPWA